MSSQQWFYHIKDDGLYFTPASYYYESCVKNPIKVSLPENMSFDEFGEKISFLYREKHGRDIPAYLLSRYMVESYADMFLAFDRALGISPADVSEIIYLYNDLTDDVKVESLFAIMDVLRDDPTCDDRARAAIFSMNAMGLGAYSKRR